MPRLILAWSVLFLTANGFAMGGRKDCALALNHVFTNPQLIDKAARIDNSRLSPDARLAYFGEHFTIVRKLQSGTPLEAAEVERLLDLMEGFPLAESPYLRAYDVVLEYLSILARHQAENYHVGFVFFRQYMKALRSNQSAAVEFYRSHLMRLWIPLLGLDPAAGPGTKQYQAMVLSQIEEVRPALDFLFSSNSIETH